MQGRHRMRGTHREVGRKRRRKGEVKEDEIRVRDNQRHNG